MKQLIDAQEFDERWYRSMGRDVVRNPAGWDNPRGPVAKLMVDYAARNKMKQEGFINEIEFPGSKEDQDNNREHHSDNDHAVAHNGDTEGGGWKEYLPGASQFRDIGQIGAAIVSPDKFGPGVKNPFKSVGAVTSGYIDAVKIGTDAVKKVEKGLVPKLQDLIDGIGKNIDSIESEVNWSQPTAPAPPKHTTPHQDWSAPINSSNGGATGLDGGPNQRPNPQASPNNPPRPRPGPQNRPNGMPPRGGPSGNRPMHHGPWRGGPMRPMHPVRPARPMRPPRPHRNEDDPTINDPSSDDWGGHDYNHDLNGDSTSTDGGVHATGEHTGMDGTGPLSHDQHGMFEDLLGHLADMKLADPTPNGPSLGDWKFDVPDLTLPDLPFDLGGKHGPGSVLSDPLKDLIDDMKNILPKLDDPVPVEVLQEPKGEPGNQGGEHGGNEEKQENPPSKVNSEISIEPCPEPDPDPFPDPDPDPDPEPNPEPSWTGRSPSLPSEFEPSITGGSCGGDPPSIGGGSMVEPSYREPSYISPDPSDPDPEPFPEPEPFLDPQTEPLEPEPFVCEPPPGCEPEPWLEPPEQDPSDPTIVEPLPYEFEPSVPEGSISVGGSIGGGEDPCCLGGGDPTEDPFGSGEDPFAGIEDPFTNCGIGEHPSMDDPSGMGGDPREHEFPELDPNIGELPSLDDPFGSDNPRGLLDELQEDIPDLGELDEVDELGEQLSPDVIDNGNNDAVNDADFDVDAGGEIQDVDLPDISNLGIGEHDSNDVINNTDNDHIAGGDFEVDAAGEIPDQHFEADADVDFGGADLGTDLDVPGSNDFSIDQPSMPDFDLPQPSLDFDVPSQLDLPDFADASSSSYDPVGEIGEIAEVDTTFDLPADVSNFDAPAMDDVDFSPVGDVDMPPMDANFDIPSMDAGDVHVPDVQFDAGSSDFAVPDIADVAVPDVPSFDMPTDSGYGDASYDVPEVNIPDSYDAPEAEMPSYDAYADSGGDYGGGGGDYASGNDYGGGADYGGGGGDYGGGDYGGGDYGGGDYGGGY